jgi:hypothetical protein
MQKPFVRSLAVVVVALAAWWAAADGLQAQAPAAGGYRAPRSKNGDGHPDLNGVWQALNTANWDLQDHGAQEGPVFQLGAMFAVPPGRGVVVGDEIPYKPEALARQKQNFAKRISTDPRDREIGDPELKCYMPGVPRAAYMPYPFQILQGAQDMLFVYQFAKSSRIVHMGKKAEAPVDSWMGWNNGRWEGETLVIDVTGLNGQAWLDRAGNYLSESAHVVERYTPATPYHLNYEATIEDPALFTRPWKIAMPLYRRMDNPNLLEFNCVEFAEQALYGSIRTQRNKVEDRR